MTYLPKSKDINKRNAGSDVPTISLNWAKTLGAITSVTSSASIVRNYQTITFLMHCYDHRFIGF